MKEFEGSGVDISTVQQMFLFGLKKKVAKSQNLRNMSDTG